jgi:uncharacterized protein (DUF1800 family)
MHRNSRRFSLTRISFVALCAASLFFVRLVRGRGAPIPDAALEADELPSPSLAANADTKSWAGHLPITELTEDEAITHALNRLGYGPRPGDIERIRKIGLETWITQQLHPETINDDALRPRLAEYATLSMTPAALITEYPRPDQAAKKLGITLDEYNKLEQTAMHPAQGLRPAPDRRSGAIVNELMDSKLLRAIYSERQLQEQLADFWFNHFNIYIYKDQETYLVTSFERDAIRPYTLGKFRDLLSATAHSPAMMIYLDNSASADPDAFERIKHASPQQKAAWKNLPPVGGRRGLNENYGREILELHTLGVDGGYTQQDVIEVAKSFTGWTVKQPGMLAEFYFDPRIHVPGEKRVLGKKIKAGGEKDGEAVLDLLAKSPATAHHISYELAERFVSDTPPPALVARMAKTFQKTKGDIREVMRTMIYSSEFWSRANSEAKIKTPFELVASAARAIGADVDSPVQLRNWVSRIGEPLYQCLPPTGYKDNAATWVNTGALLNRLNFAIQLASNRMRGAEVDLPSRLGSDIGGDPKLALDRATQIFLRGQVSQASLATLEKETSDPQITHARLDDPVKQVDLGVITGLVLGTPEFQRR